MAVSATFRVKQINSIQPNGDGWNRHMDIDVDDIEIADAIKAEEIVPEYSASDLLEAIGESDVIDWLEKSGYMVIND
ncbi:TPA: hypothetical protein ACY3HI_003480 [Citrobacter braakii]